MSTQDGGPAFPVQELNHDGTPYSLQAGMSLRDYFAAKAMEGLLAQSNGTALGSTAQVAAEYAYQLADAMLAARKGTP